MTATAESSAEIDAAAAAWAARADRGPLSPKDQADLEAWAAVDPRRAGAYARALAVSVHLDRAQGLGKDFEPRRHPAARALDRRRLILSGGLLAAASVVGIVGFVATDRSARLTTRKGDIRRASLADGSAATLNTDTRLRTAFDDRGRRIFLLQGEALFDVAKDPARPFVVTAGDVRVRAVGTSFTVRRLDDSAVTVVVREGVVEVTRGNEPPVRLAAAQTVQVAVGAPLAPAAIGGAAVERAMAWRQGMIDLDGLTLGEAAGQFARYSDRRIVIDDPVVARLKVAGLFSASDPEGFARAAALSLGLTAETQADGVRLRGS
ncbi:FecR domain-containing protein [Caulobacter sp. 73W]|uniref:FecR domain-containing protein n=1 Tax=Caulobacter sp. 73W TaxID=3161137 RepID=A0AB39KYL2_9CAUL